MRIAYAVVACALSAGLCAAQTANNTGQLTPFGVVRKAVPRTSSTFHMLEVGAPKLVKGAPYSARTISEFEQTLADGNRMIRSTTGTVCRDSEGRMRRELPIGGTGLLGSAADLPMTIIITDPVAGFTYTLNPQDKSVTKMPLPPQAPTAGGEPIKKYPGWDENPPVTPPFAYQRGFMDGISDSLSRSQSQTLTKENLRTESLGTKPFDGVVAEGMRMTLTIPAGQIGNERPMDFVTERWYSQQLQAPVLWQYTDPRTGTTTERLTGINLAEPSPLLFEIPPEYKKMLGLKKSPEPQN